MEDNSLPPAQLIRPKSASDSLEGADTNLPVSSYSSSQNYPIESLEVHSEGASPQSTVAAPVATLRSVPFSRRRATLVSLGITGVVVLLTAFSAMAIVRRGPEDQKNSQATIPTQDVSLGEESNTIPTELQGSEESLLVNGDIITRGVLKVKSDNFVSILRSVPLTANQTISLPNASGTICLDANNCNFATSAQLNQTQAQVNQLSQIIPQPFDGVTALNGQNGSVSIQGSVNRITVSTSNGVVTLATPQDLDANANVQFNSLTVNAAGEIKSNILRQTAAGSDIAIDAFNDDVILISGGRTFLLPAGGGGTQTICTTQGNCGGGGATPVILAPGSAQPEATADASIFINDTGGGNLIQLQSSGIDRLVVTPAGDTTVGGTLTVTGLGSGVVRATGGLLSTGAVNLPTEVAGTLAVANGGTGAASLTANGVLIGNGTGAITSVVSGGTGLCFMSNAGAPSWQACPGGGGVTTLNAMTGAITVQGTANQINVASGAGLITLSTPQDIATTSNVQFNNLNLSGQADIAGHMALGNGAAVSTTAALNIVETFAAACPFNCTAIDAHTTGQAASNQMTSLVTGVTMDNAGALSAAGIHVASNSVLGTGVIVDNYGIFIAAQTAGTNDYGIYVQAADTYAFWADAGLSRFDGGVEIQGGSPIILEGATDNAFETTLAVTDPSADNTITLPNASGVVCLDSGNCIGSGGGAPNSATYLLATNDPTLTNDRALAAGSNIAFTDAGANNSFTIATVQNPTFTTSVTTPILQSAGALTITSSGAGNDITLTSADQVIVNGITDINSYAAIGNNAGAQSISALSLGHAFDSGVNCAAFGCHGLLATVDANNVGGVNPGITGLYSNVSVSAGSLLQSAGVFVATTSGAGTVTDNYGMYIANQTKGTNDYGLYIQGADTYALWVDSGTSRFDGNLEFEGVTEDAFEFTLTVADPTADRTYTIPNSSATTDTFCLVTLGNCAGSGGGVTGSGTNNRVAKFTSTGSTIGDSTISDDGTNVSITGDFTIQGGGLTAGSITQVGSLLLHDGDGETLTLTLPDVSGSYSLLFPASVGAANQCLKAQDGSGTLFWEDCLGGGGGGGITSLDGQTGPAITINNATGAANVITIDNAAADGTTKGIAAFNATNFSAASGVVNTIQGISTAATPQFAGLTLTGNLQVDGNTTLGNAAGDVLTINGTAIATPNDLNFDSNTFFIDESANAVALGTTSTSSAFTNNMLTIQSSATKDEIYILGDNEFNLAAEGSSYLTFDRDDDFASAEFAVLTGNTAGAGVTQLLTVEKDGDFISSGDGTFQGGSITVGAASLQGNLVLYDGGAGVAAHTGTLQVVGTLGQNTSYILQDPGVASVDICLSSGNCVGGAGGAPNNAEYLLVSLNGTLTNDRALTAGNNISFTDAGANGNFTVATVQNPTFTTSVTTPTLQNAGNLSITNSGAGNDITVTSQDLITLDAGAGGITLSDATTVSTTLGIGTAATSSIVTINGSAGQSEIYIANDSEFNMASDGSMYLTFDANDNAGVSEFAILTGATGIVEIFNISGNGSVQGDGSFTSGNAGTQGSFILNDGSSNIGTIRAAALGQNTVYNLLDPGVASIDICLSSGNCAGAGSGVTTAGGTANRIAMFSGTQAIGNSWLLQNGSTLELDTSRNLSITGGNLVVANNTTLGDVAGDTLTVNGTAIALPNNLNFDTNTLFIDSTNRSVAVGTATVDAKLTVVRSSTSTTASGVGTPERGLSVTMSDTGNVSTGTDVTTGAQINVTRTGGSGSGVFTTYGLDIQGTGSTAGTSTLYGLNVNVSGADTNYAAQFQGGAVLVGTAPGGLNASTYGDPSGTSGKPVLDVYGALRTTQGVSFTSDCTQPNCGRTEYYTGSDVAAHMYSTNTSGSGSPFTAAGNLVIQGRGGTSARGIFFATGTNTTVLARMWIEAAGTIRAGADIVPDYSVDTGDTTRDLGSTSQTFTNLYLDASTSTGLQFGNNLASISYQSTPSRIEIKGTGQQGSLFIEDKLYFGMASMTISDDGVDDNLQAVATYYQIDVDETANAAVPVLTIDDISTHAREGQLLIITNTENDGSSASFTINTVLNTAYVPGGTVTLDTKDSITLVYDDTHDYWVTLAYSNN